MHTVKNPPTHQSKPIHLSSENISESDGGTLTFADMGLNEGLLKALARLKFEKPTDIQAELIPI
ncbi:MAG: hypothetical protein IID33_10365, partial [Planctomycetes bacterium]|nr:hypothetical protein [Planctomycetota bacterium]